MTAFVSPGRNAFEDATGVPIGVGRRSDDGGGGGIARMTERSSVLSKRGVGGAFGHASSTTRSPSIRSSRMDDDAPLESSSLSKSVQSISRDDGGGACFSLLIGPACSSSNMARVGSSDSNRLRAPLSIDD